jgi:riboflavin kinase / FMN adenylyltransferase
LVKIHASLDEVGLAEAWLASGTWLTIGSFDGVHLGHQVLIRRLVETAHAAHSPALVLTFWPYPAVVLRNLIGPYYLTDPEERETLLERLGVDQVITISFDRELANLSAAEFMTQLTERLSLRRLVVGYNFALGHGREGNIERLQELGEQLGYSVETIPPQAVDAKVVSSSGLRSFLADGEVGKVAQGLGRWYRVSGEIVHGDGRGHGLGIPTANLAAPAEKLLPAVGVYACWAWVDGYRRKAVTNIGFRPTFESQELALRIETHLLDFDQDLYGHPLQMDFVARLRGEQRFPSVQALLAQIEEDIRLARGILQEEVSDGI